MTTEHEILKLIPDLEKKYKVGGIYVGKEAESIVSSPDLNVRINKSVGDVIRRALEAVKKGEAVYVALGKAAGFKWGTEGRIAVPKFWFVADDIDELYENLLLAYAAE